MTPTPAVRKLPMLATQAARKPALTLTSKATSPHTMVVARATPYQTPKPPKPATTRAKKKLTVPAMPKIKTTVNTLPPDQADRLAHRVPRKLTTTTNPKAPGTPATAFTGAPAPAAPAPAVAAPAAAPAAPAPQAAPAVDPFEAAIAGLPPTLQAAMRSQHALDLQRKAALTATYNAGATAASGAADAATQRLGGLAALIGMGQVRPEVPGAVGALGGIRAQDAQQAATAQAAQHVNFASSIEPMFRAQGLNALAKYDASASASQAKNLQDYFDQQFKTEMDKLNFDQQQTLQTQSEKATAARQTANNLVTLRGQGITLLSNLIQAAIVSGDKASQRQLESQLAQFRVNADALIADANNKTRVTVATTKAAQDKATFAPSNTPTSRSPGKGWTWVPGAERGGGHWYPPKAASGAKAKTASPQAVGAATNDLRKLWVGTPAVLDPVLGTPVKPALPGWQAKKLNPWLWVNRLYLEAKSRLGGDATAAANVVYTIVGPARYNQWARKYGATP